MLIACAHPMKYINIGKIKIQLLSHQTVHNWNFVACLNEAGCNREPWNFIETEVFKISISVDKTHPN